MPKITKTLGTGMTREGIVTFDQDQPGDVQAQIDAAIESFSRTSFTALSRRLVRLAAGILSASGVPSDPTKLYNVAPDGGIAVVDGHTKPGAANDPLPLPLLVEALGYAHDSPEGYAAEVLTLLVAARIHLAKGQHDEALAVAFRLGELVNEAGTKEVFEPTVEIGERVREGGRRAHAQTYGTRQERDARDAAYIAAFDELIATGAGRMEAYRAVAKSHRVSVATVRRAIKRRSLTG